MLLEKHTPVLSPGGAPDEFPTRLLLPGRNAAGVRGPNTRKTEKRWDVINTDLNVITFRFKTTEVLLACVQKTANCFT